MTLTNSTDADIAELAKATTPCPRMVPYVDPLAPEPANPYRYVDGYIVVDSPCKT